MTEKKAREKYKAEMWDKMQYLFRKYYDRMVHTAVYFDGELQLDILEKAYKYLLRRVPLLHSSYHNHFIKPYWKENICWDAKKCLCLIEVKEDSEVADAVEGFLTKELPANGIYQISAAVVRCKGKDVWCQIVNHMCMDGDDNKAFNVKLFEVYNMLLSQSDIQVELKAGDRSHWQIYSAFSDEEKKTALGLYKNISAVKSRTKFPFSVGGQNRKRILLQEIESNTFDIARTKAKTLGYTVNDLLLTAYIRGLYKLCEIDREKPLAVPCMVDLRRHISGGDSMGFSNHIGFMVCNVECCGETFEATLQSVAEKTKRAKEDKYLGLYSLPLLNLAYRLFPQFLAEIAIQIGYTNPYTGMSNLGVLKEEDLHIDGLTTQKAWMTGGIKTKPYMQLALTCFKGQITLSIAEKCNDEDAQMLQKLLTAIFEEIRGYANQ